MQGTSLAGIRILIRFLGPNAALYGSRDSLDQLTLLYLSGRHPFLCVCGGGGGGGGGGASLCYFNIHYFY